MKSQFTYLIYVLKRISILMLLYTLMRLLFYFLNHDLFPSLTLPVFLSCMWNGLRFDLSAILYLNLIFILLWLIPHPFKNRKWFRISAKIIFYITNIAALLFILSDMLYFRYSLKRLTYDVIGIANDAANLMPAFLKDFWWMFLVLGVIIFLLEWIYRKTEIKIHPEKTNWILQSVIFIFASGSFVIGARGTFDIRPLTTINAASMVDIKFVSLVTNTPFSLMTSIGQRGVVEKNFFSEKDCKKYFRIDHAYIHSTPVDSLAGHPNVVVILLESFSKEYNGYFIDDKRWTPFLDSLERNSFLCVNAFANGKHSNEGNVATLASIPPLMNDPLMNSVYQNNRITGLGSLMKELGYTTAYFHCAHNGSFNLDAFSGAAGFDTYWGRDQYNAEHPGNNDDDGAWGIWDEPFFQWSAQKMNAMPQPFCCGMFSLTSHHPFNIPEKYKSKFPEGALPILKTIAYSDYALRKFFETISKMPWFNHTLFVITADHCGPSGRDSYKSKNGEYKIPILFYYPGGNLKGIFPGVVQQTDIMPSILDFVGYKKPFRAFGESVFHSPDERFTVNMMDGIFQIIGEKYSLLFDGEKPIAMFDYKTDSLETNNLLGKIPDIETQLTNKVKAFIQTYNHAMITNTLSAR